MTVHKKCKDLVPDHCGKPAKSAMDNYKHRSGTHGFFTSYIEDPGASSATINTQTLYSTTSVANAVARKSALVKKRNLVLGIQIPSMEGYLHTYYPRTGWKLKYYRLQQDKLFHFNTHEDIKPLGFDSVYEVLAVEKNSSSRDFVSDDKLVFRIRLVSKNLILKPSDQLQTTKKLWVYNLQQWHLLCSFYLKQTQLNSMGVFSYLPRLLTLHLFMNYLDDADLARMSMVCKRWYLEISDVRRRRLTSNWKMGNYTVRSLDAHSNAVREIQVPKGKTVHAGNFKFLTCSSDRTVRMWEVTPAHITCLMTLGTAGMDSDAVNSSKMHHGGINCFQTKSDLIITGSADKTIKVWDSYANLIKTLVGHTEGVLCLQVSDNRVISGAMDNLIKIWDVEKGKEVHTLKGHRGYVSTLQMEASNILVSGSWDKTIIQWDLRIKDPRQHVINAHEAEVSCLQYEHYKLVTGSYDSTVKMWDRRKWNAVNTLKDHSDRIQCLAFRANTLATGSYDKTIKLYDRHWWTADTEYFHQTLEGHTDAVSSISLTNTCLLSGSLDKTVRIWNFQSFDG